jgi:hypothetical protein
MVNSLPFETYFVSIKEHQCHIAYLIFHWILIQFEQLIFYLKPDIFILQINNSVLFHASPSVKQHSEQS